MFPVGSLFVLTTAMAVSASTSDAATVSLNGLLSGLGGAGALGFIYWVGKLLLNRLIPSRSDARANVTLVLDGLNQMVKVLQEEKLSDATRLNDKTTRIEQLESAADKDYDRISELRAEIIDLRNRLAIKDRHINTLVSELRKLGAQVTGVELDDIDHLEVTMPAAKLRATREGTK